MLGIAKQLIPQMTLAEKEGFPVAVKSAIAAELAGAATPYPDACPRCGCPHVARKGRGRHGEQRRLCKGCAGTFPPSTLSVIGSSKLPAETRMAHAERMAGLLSSRDSAGRCSVGLPHSMAHAPPAMRDGARPARPFQDRSRMPDRLDACPIQCEREVLCAARGPTRREPSKMRVGRRFAGRLKRAGLRDVRNFGSR